MFWCTPIITNLLQMLLAISQMKHTDGQPTRYYSSLTVHKKKQRKTVYFVCVINFAAVASPRNSCHVAADLHQLVNLMSADK